ncbi:ATP-binding protein [Candidatus Omnitrophota bacterium]
MNPYTFLPTIVLAASLLLIFELLYPAIVKGRKRRQLCGLIDNLYSIPDTEGLMSGFRKILKQVLHIDTAEIIFRDAQDKLILCLLRYKRPLSVRELSEKEPEIFEENNSQFKGLENCTLIPFAAKQKPIGFLAAGRNTDKSPLSEQDAELLKLSGSKASLVFSNAKLLQELVASREIEHFHHLSSFLVQELGNLESTLSATAQNAENAEVKNTISRIQRLREQLSVLPEKLELKTSLVNVNVLIEEVITKTKLDNLANVRLLRLFDYVPQLDIDAGYIAKVIQGLLFNAVESMPNGGVLTVKTGYEHGITAANGSYVRIVVNDTGCGMDEEFMRKRLFKPFQSSKRNGIGMALFQCKAILEAHNGNILVESNPGKGTNFTLELPVC